MSCRLHVSKCGRKEGCKEYEAALAWRGELEWSLKVEVKEESCARQLSEWSCAVMDTEDSTSSNSTTRQDQVGVQALVEVERTLEDLPGWSWVCESEHASGRKQMFG